MNSVKKIVESGGGWPAKICAWLAFAGAMICFLFMVWIAWKNEPWAYVIYAEKPIPHFLCGLGGLFAWYFLRRGYQNTWAQWRGFAAKCVLLIVSAVFAFGIGEWGVRNILRRAREANSMSRLKEIREKGLRLPVRSSHPLASIIQPAENENLVYELMSNLEIQFGHRRLHTNHEGLRESRDYEHEPKPNTVRIVGIGDSGMFGWNVEQDEDYLAVLEKRLAAKQNGITYEVINLGVPGYNTHLEVERLKARGLDYKPDIVVVGWCNNDFELPFFLLEKDTFSKWDTSYLYHLVFDRKNFTEVVTHTRFRDMRNYDIEKIDPNLKEYADVGGVEKAMVELQQLSQEHDFRVLVFGPMNPTIVDICKRIGFAYFNTLEKIPADKYPAEWAVHFMHPRAEGHKVLAEYMEQELDQRGWLTSFHAASAAVDAKTP